MFKNIELCSSCRHLLMEDELSTPSKAGKNKKDLQLETPKSEALVQMFETSGQDLQFKHRGRAHLLAVWPEQEYSNQHLDLTCGRSDATGCRMAMVTIPATGEISDAVGLAGSEAVVVEEGNQDGGEVCLRTIESDGDVLESEKFAIAAIFAQLNRRARVSRSMFGRGKKGGARFLPSTGVV
jgi:hypothetical protein